MQPAALHHDGRGPVSVAFDSSTGAVTLHVSTGTPRGSQSQAVEAEGSQSQAAEAAPGVTVNASVSLHYYQSHTGDYGFTPSGAYVFRPDASQRARQLKPAGAPRVVRSAVMSELRQSYGEWQGCHSPGFTRLDWLHGTYWLSSTEPCCSAAGCALERQTLIPGFHLIGYRLWV